MIQDKHTILFLAFFSAFVLCLYFVTGKAVVDTTAAQDAGSQTNKKRPKLSVGLNKVQGGRRLDFKIKDMDGQLREASEWDNKVVVLIFWAPWSPFAQKTMPNLIQLQNKYVDQGLQILSLTIYEDEGKVSDFYKDYSLNFPVLIGKGVTDLAKAYGIISIPHIIYVDRHGDIVFRHVGYRDQHLIETVIRELL